MVVGAGARVVVVVRGAAVVVVSELSDESADWVAAAISVVAVSGAGACVVVVVVVVVVVDVGGNAKVVGGSSANSLANTAAATRPDAAMGISVGPYRSMARASPPGVNAAKPSTAAKATMSKPANAKGVLPRKIGELRLGKGTPGCARGACHAHGAPSCPLEARSGRSPMASRYLSNTGRRLGSIFDERPGAELGSIRRCQGRF